ncbi:phage tail sheath family protein [Serinicoccus sediminis]|uniref:phage tail sheath family protein n=1 Tax=Serinicoccus sediminis TaxID=2306021 RepID=UPI0010212CD6|nr:phage tail sheath subtilisin-like domain-containing protein [Serinicoccus sediminis]
MPTPAPGAAGGPIVPLPTSVTGFVGAADDGPVGSPVTVTSAADFHDTFGISLGPDRPLGVAVDLFFANGGQQAVVVRAVGPAPEQLVPADGTGGVHALDRSGITVLVLPGLTSEHGDQVRAALERCAAYRAVLILDLPPGAWSSVTGVGLAGLGEHQGRAAAYHPWVLVDGMAVPPSGAVAGVVARTDAERGVWTAPAGVELRGIEGFAETLDRARTDELTAAGVNALREFAGRGRLVWGARTVAGARSGDPEWRYVPVRRLTDHVLSSVSAGLAFVADRPDDAALWVQVRRLVEDFLHGLWRQGAFAGVTADEAFGVGCGLGESMTEADVRAGRVVVSLWIAPSRPAEFDVHTLTLQAAGTASGTRQLEGADTHWSAGGRPNGRRRASGRPGLDRVERRRRGLGRVDLGRVMSRYIGETEKNVGRVLDEADRSGPLLAFDEADALFGRRTDGVESADGPEAADPPDEPDPR